MSSLSLSALQDLRQVRTIVLELIAKVISSCHLLHSPHTDPRQHSVHPLSHTLRYVHHLLTLALHRRVRSFRHLLFLYRFSLYDKDWNIERMSDGRNCCAKEEIFKSTMPM